MKKSFGEIVENKVGRNLDLYCKLKDWRFINNTRIDESKIQNKNSKAFKQLKADRQQGTDYRINNIRIDVTVNQAKDEKITPGYENVYLGKYGQVECSIRRSNGYVGTNGNNGVFHYPVLVVKALDNKSLDDAVDKLTAFFTGNGFIKVMKLFLAEVDELGTYKVEQNSFTNAQHREWRRTGIVPKIPVFKCYKELFPYYFN